MYTLPKFEELQFLINLRISNIKIFEYTSIINFENSSVEINGYNENFSILEKCSKQIYSINQKVDKLLNHIITSYYIKDAHLYLTLDNDFIIDLSADDSDYECFTISNNEKTFVV